MALIEVVMPKMGESVMEGTVLTWHKQVGETIETDEALLEIGTDKVDSEVPSPSTGIIKQILVPEGETVEVGTPLAILETDVTATIDVQQPTPSSDDSVPAPPEEVKKPVATAKPTSQPKPNAQSTVPVVMPKMGESVMEGTVLTWHKKEGEAIEVDEALLEIGTDKVDTEVPSPVAGIVYKILVPEGETVEVGSPLAVVVVGDELPQIPSTTSEVSQQTPTQTTPSQGDGAVPTPSSNTTIPRMSEEGRFYSPLVRSIAEKEGVSESEIAQIAGTGREGRVTKQDLLNFISIRGSVQMDTQVQDTPVSPKPQHSPIVVSDAGGGVEILQMDRMRQIISEHMTRSKATSAHVTSFAEIDVTNLVKNREKNKEAFQKREGVKLTYTPYFVHAAVKALRSHPLLNSSVEGKQILIKKQYHIGIAVAIGKTGLIVPTIRNAGAMNIIGLAHAVSDVAERARNKQLLPDELLGGTFTVTNVGSLGSIMGTPIINQPQVGILATGAIVKKPVVVEIEGIGDTIAIRQMMFVSLSYDHRIIDGAMAASFLSEYRQTLENIDPQGIL